MSDPILLKSAASFVNEIQIGQHRLVMDEPLSSGGTDAGPTPYDLLASALGGCTSMTLRFYANRENLPLEGVEIAVSHGREYAKDCADCTTKSGYVHRFVVRIKLLGPLTAEQKTTLLSVAKRCPVYKTLTSEITIEESLID